MIGSLTNIHCICSVMQDMWSYLKCAKLWHALVLLRVVSTLLLQPGYIHPDEFFQSVEIVAGNSLTLAGCKHFRMCDLLVASICLYKSRFVPRAYAVIHVFQTASFPVLVYCCV